MTRIIINVVTSESMGISLLKKKRRKKERKKERKKKKKKERMQSVVDIFLFVLLLVFGFVCCCLSHFSRDSFSYGIERTNKTRNDIRLR